MEEKSECLDCKDCTYFDCCPVLWHKNNSACLTIQKKNDVTAMTDEEIYRLVRDAYNNVNKDYIEEQIRIAKEHAENKSKQV